MPDKISQYKPVDVICQCGAIIKYCNMPQHILTYIEGLVGRENIEFADHYKY